MDKQGLWACAAASVMVVAGLAGELHRDGRYWVMEETAAAQARDVRIVRVRSDGPVTVRGVAGDVVRWTVEERVPAASEADARGLLSRSRVSQTARGQFLDIVCEGPAPRPVVELSLQVPKDVTSVFVATTNGAVRATGFAGALEVTDRVGAIDLDRIGGPVTARTGGGDIRMGRIAGSVYCFTGGGAIRASSIGADSRLETAGGEIYVDEAAGRLLALAAGGNIQIRGAGGPVTARTNGGLIEIGNAGGPVTADAGGGAIRVMAPGGARCQTSEGLIRLKDAAGALLAATGSGSIIAELMAGRALLDSRLSTRDGDITVVIPGTSAVTVLARIMNADGRGRILSDFPEIRSATDGAGAPGEMLAQGSLNGGGPLLRITAAGGCIYLRRR